MELIYSKTVNSELGLYDMQLHNCGFFKNIKYNIPTSRKNGRSDYHIILVTNGKVKVEIKGKNHIANSGSIIFLPPNVPHNYTYFKGEDTDYGWIHFDGRILPLILQEFPFNCGIYPIEDIQKVRLLLERIYTACSKKRSGNEFLCNSLLGEFFVKLGQLAFLTPHIPEKENRLLELLQQIDISPEKPLSNKDLAESFDISEFHFIRIFKAKTGLTPIQYQIQSKLKKAVGLLLDTQLNVSEIAYMCGFSDPLYFSALFKKKMGQSPTLYRKSHY